MPPRVRGLPIIGNLMRLIRNPTPLLLRASRLGDVTDLDVPIARTYLVSRPDLIEQVLVTDNRIYIKDQSTRALRELLGEGLLTSEGELWRRQRRLAQPGFHRERVASYADVMVEYTEEMLDAFRDGDDRNIHDDMMSLTRRIVAKTLFDADVTKEAARIAGAFEEVNKRFADVPPGVPLIDKIPTPGQRRYKRAARALDDAIYGFINARRASGRDAGDLLSMLMGSHLKSDGDAASEGLKKSEEGEARMSDRQLRDEAMTLFLAGHETTALALSWTWLLLSQNPEAEARLVEELKSALGGRAPTADDLPRLRYTERVIYESMRLYPPAWAIGREPVEDTEIGGYYVPKGTQVWMSQWVAHRDPRYFDDPEAFRPERWENDLQKRIPKYAYFPFGGGPRLCIGASFAMMESTLLLATIARRFKIVVDPSHPIQTSTAVTMRPRFGIKARLSRRA